MLHFEYGTGATSVTILELPATAAVTGLPTSADTALALTLKWSKAGANTSTV